MKSNNVQPSTESWTLVEQVQTGLQELASYAAETLGKKAVVSIWKQGHGASQQIIPNCNDSIASESIQVLETWLNQTVVPPPWASTGSSVTPYPTWVEGNDRKGLWTGFCLSGPEVEDYWGILFWNEAPVRSPANSERCLELERLAPMLNTYRLLQRKTKELAESDQRHQETEKALRDSEAFYHSLVETLPQNIFRKDLEGHFTFVNDSFCESLEQSRENVLGKTDCDFFPENLAQKYCKDDERVIRSGKPYDTVEAHHSKTGDIYVQVIKTPLYDANSEVVGIQGIFWDVTERKKVEEALAYERDLLRALLDYMPDSLYFKDKESRFIRVSKSLARRLGLKSAKMAEGKTDFDFFDAIHAQPAFDAEQKILQTGEPALDLLEKEVTRDGRESYVLTNKVPFRDKHGTIIGTFGISKDITDLIEAEHELKRARDFAIQSARMKSEFVANMSHEIRTPMNGVIGITELLLETELDNTQRDFSETIRGSAESLLSLIDDILDFSKLEAGKLVFENIPFKPQEVVEDIAELLAKRAQTKGVELLSWTDLSIPCRLNGDPNRIRQILLNLVGNAVKFTESGEVALEVYSVQTSGETQTLCFEVRDTGIGIPENKQSRLFNAFVQADSSTTRKYGGSGLGLVISKQLAEGMGGDITFESAYGKGSTFRLTLTLGCLNSSPDSESAKVPDWLHAPNNLKNVSVLVSNPSLAEYLSQFLQAMKAEVHCLESLDHLTRFINNFNKDETVPELIILDIDELSPDQRQLQRAKEIAELTEPHRIPVICLTSLESFLHQGRFKTSANLHCLPKPVRWRRLNTFIDQIINSTTDSGRLITSQDDNWPEENEKSSLDPFYTSYSKEVIQEGPGPKPYKPTSQVAVPECQSSLDILVAEDNPVNQMVTNGQLEQLGHRCQLVLNGQEALEALERQTFDLIFMDCHMPVMDGYETTRAIRRLEASHPDRKKITIIALTANAMEEDRQKCLSVGMDYYLSKPTRREQLKELLDHFQIEGTLPGSDGFSANSEKAVVESDILNDPAPTSHPDTQLVDNHQTTDTQPISIEYPTLNTGPLLNFSEADNPFSLNLAYQLVESYLRDSAKTISALDEAVLGKDIQEIRRLAHSLKGSSRNIGAEKIGFFAEALEDQTDSTNDDAEFGMRDIVREIHAEFDQVKAALEKLKSSFPPRPQA